MTTRITSENITDATVVASDLAAGVGATQWQAVKTSNFNASKGEGYFINTTGGAVTVTLPATGVSTQGDTIRIKDYARTWGTNNVTIASILTDGVANANTLSTSGATITFVYMDGTKGWSIINEDTSSELNLPPTFVAATGGTVATSGDFKIHTFTGDSNFVVSSIGNDSTVATGGPNAVSYMVVAGGGAGSTAHGGGGGAGGFREGRVATPHYTASPLVAPGLTVTVQTYPITVGGGGAGGNSNPSTQPGNPGSNSVFATITSAGGGSVSRYNTSGPVAAATKDGGSGVGHNPHGNGNTPPVSPPQGNNGGQGPGGAPLYYGGGGGGATAVGTNGGPSTGGTGGAGATTHISGSPVAYAGGGGGGVYSNGPLGASGGAGGGGDGGGKPGYQSGAMDGTANRGGGGGGGGSSPGGATANSPGAGGQGPGGGGKGVVIIRYKFQ